MHGLYVVFVILTFIDSEKNSMLARVGLLLGFEDPKNALYTHTPVTPEHDVTMHTCYHIHNVDISSL